MMWDSWFMLRRRSIRELVEATTPEWTPFTAEYYDRPITVLVERTAPKRMEKPISKLAVFSLDRLKEVKESYG